MRIAPGVAWHLWSRRWRDDPNPVVLPRPRGDSRHARGALRVTHELQLLPAWRRPLRLPARMGVEALALPRSFREGHRRGLRDDPRPERDLPRAHGRSGNDPIGRRESVRRDGAHAPRLGCGLGSATRPPVLDLSGTDVAEA